MDLVTRRGNAEELEAEIAELEKQALADAGNAPIKEVVQPNTTPNAPDPKVEETWEKRYGNLRRFAQKEKDELNKKLADLEDRVAQANTTIPTNPDDIKKWAEKNPIAAAMIKSLAGEEVNKKAAKVEAEVEELALDRVKQQVMRTHSDFDEIVNDDAFHDWAETQPDAVQEAIYGKAVAANLIWAIGVYKMTKDYKPTNPTREAAKGITTRTKNPRPADANEKTFSESQVEVMSSQEYEANQDAIFEAIRNGKFDYDVTGAAR